MEPCHRAAKKIQNELPQTHDQKTRENVYATSVVFLHLKSEVGGVGDVIAELSVRSRVGPDHILLDNTTVLLKGSCIDWKRAWHLNAVLQIK